MSDDWEGSDSDASASAPPTQSKPAPPSTKPVIKKKWEGEDEEDEAPVSDWEASSESEDEAPAVVAPVAPPKKKGTLKAKLAEKEAEKAARKANGEDQDEYDSDAVLDPRAKAKLDKEKELKSDLSNAADLLGAVAIGGKSSSELDWLTSFQPRTKDDFILLSNKIIETIISRHQSKPLYASFVEAHVRALAQPLKDVEVRKAASGLTTLANEKQKEQRDKASGKKKPATKAKPMLGAAKGNKLDTGAYEEVLDDFGNDPNDFM